MTTVINTPRSNEDSSGMNMIIGVFIVLLAIVLFFAYALPAIRSNTGTEKQQDSSIDVNVKMPAEAVQGNINQPPAGNPPAESAPAAAPIQ